MAMNEHQVRMMLADYVQKGTLAQQLQDYVTHAEIPERMSPVADAKVAEAITTDEIQNKIAQIAESAVTRLMQEGFKSFDEKLTQLRNEVGDLTQLRNEVEDLKDSRKPTQDDAKEKEDEKEKDDEKDDEKSDDPKDKEIKQLKNMFK